MRELEIDIGRLDEIDDPGCREFRIGDGDWPFKGFVVRQGDQAVAWENVCPHAGHALNWKPDAFLTPGKDAIICASHGAVFSIEGGECLAGPCPGRSLKAVPLRIDNGRVYVRGPDSRHR